MVDLRLENHLAIEAQRDVQRIQRELREERDQVTREVHRLLDGGWGGRAATQYSAGWDEWHEGAEDMLSALTLIGELMGAVRQQIVEADQQAAQASTLMISRLGPMP